MTLVVGRLVSVWTDALGCAGRISVRGAVLEVALDLVPGAAVGDTLLVESGVALQVMRDVPREEPSCA